MGILSRLLRRSPKDLYWDRFINGPVNDPNNELATAFRSAPGGVVFPTKSELPEPSRLGSDLAQLTQFLGAASFGVTTTDPSDLRPVDDTTDPAGLAASYPLTLVCTVHAEHDPETALGVGGQQPRRESADVAFSLAAYIRELGYEARVCPVDSAKVAIDAGLGSRRADGRFVSKEHGPHVFVGDAVLTDLPVALGRPTESA